MMLMPQLIDTLPSNITYVRHEVIQKISTLVSDTYNPATRVLNLSFSSLEYGTDNAISVNVYTVVNELAGVCNGSFSNTASGTFTGASGTKTSTRTTTITNKKDELLYITRNDILGRRAIKSSTDQIKLQIYLYKYEEKNNEWSSEIPFNNNNKEYNVAHAAISPNGDIMVFSSDMPGGYGKMDLYICKKEGDKWGIPVNLGAKINTQEHEVFPSLNSDNLLIFSSFGFNGMGGLDLYYTYLSNSEPEYVKHFPYPVNSIFDDFGMILSEDSKNALLASNRDEGNGNDDIYKLTIKNTLIPESLFIPIKKTFKLHFTGLARDKKTLVPLEGKCTD